MTTRSLAGAKKLTISNLSYSIRSGQCTVSMKIDETSLPISDGSYTINNNTAFTVQATPINNVRAELVVLQFKLAVEY